LIVIITLIIFWVGISILIHEVGHLIMAKRVGFEVKELNIGWGPDIIKKKWKGTIYSLKLLPIWACCSINELGDDIFLNEVKYNKKKIVKKIKTLIAGPLMDFILVFFLIFYLAPSYSNVVLGVQSPSTAEEIGIQKGDIIIQVDQEEITTYSQFAEKLYELKGQEVKLKIERQGLVKEKSFLLNNNINPNEDWFFGVLPDKLNYSLFERTRGSFNILKNFFIITGDIIRNIFSKNNSVESSGNGTMGIIGIIRYLYTDYQMYSTYSLRFATINFITSIMIINFIIMLVNLIPYPALDGGRVLIYCIELIKGDYINKKIKAVTLTWANILLFLWLIYILLRDILFFI